MRDLAGLHHDKVVPKAGPYFWLRITPFDLSLGSSFTVRIEVGIPFFCSIFCQWVLKTHSFLLLKEMVLYPNSAILKKQQ